MDKFTCKLCGEEYDLHGPVPDKLCDGCWELKTRVESQPDLARQILKDMESK